MTVTSIFIRYRTGQMAILIVPAANCTLIRVHKLHMHTLSHSTAPMNVCLFQVSNIKRTDNQAAIYHQQESR